MAGPLDNTNPLFRPFLAPAAVPNGLGTSIAMPSAAPSLALPASLGVSRLPPTQTERDSAERNRLIDTGSGVDQISNPLVRGIARAGDILGSVFAPRVAQALPGTTLHHNLQVGQATANLEKDQGVDQAAATLEDSKAQAKQRESLAAQEEAKAEALRDPRKAVDPSKTVQTDNGVFQLNPETGKYDVRVGDKVEKPKNIEEQAYEYAISQGQSPLDAYSAVYNAKNTKDAGLPQQYLDAIRSGDSVKAGLIKKVIQDTSTAPKIQVIQAAAAARPTAAPVDTSDPDTAEAVKSVANGSVKLSEVFGRGATMAQKAKFVAAVKAVNPSYNSGDHDIENSSRRYMVSGQGGQTLNAINTAYHHLDQLDNAARALKNGDSKALNTIANELGVQFQKGASPQVLSDLVKVALKGEIAKAFTGAGATVDEQRNLDSSFSNANSLDTMLGVAKQARKLLEGKEQALKGQYDAGKKGEANFGALNGGADQKVDGHYDPVTKKVVYH